MWPQLLPYSKCCEQSASRVGEGRREGFGLCRWRSEDNLQICSVPVKMRWMSSFTCCDHSYLIGCKWRKAGRGLRTRLLFGHIFRWRLGTNQSRLRTCRKHLSFQNFMYILTYCSYLTHLSTCSVRDILSFSCHLLIIFTFPDSTFNLKKKYPRQWKGNQSQDIRSCNVLNWHLPAIHNWAHHTDWEE